MRKMFFKAAVFAVILGTATNTLLSACIFAENDISLDLSAKSAVVINADTGNIIYEKNADEQRAMASTTKIMTALLTAESGSLDEKFTADSYAIKVEGTSMGLREGDIVTRRALLYGMLLPSGNDAANAAAVSVSGSMGEFVKLMNKKAEKLGLKNTHFANPSGLDAEGHYTTAYELALLAKAALENPVFAEICKCSSARVEFGNPPYMRSLANSNKMLWQYEGCTGVKTGFTDNARRCLVSSAERGGVRLISVTLNAPDDWNDHKKLLDYGFTQVKPTRIVLPSPIALPVVNGEDNQVELILNEEITAALTQKETEELYFHITAEPFLYAGFEKGKKAGEVSVYLKDKKLFTADLITKNKVSPLKIDLNFFEKFWLIILRIFG